MKKFNSICLITPDVSRLRKFYQAVLALDPSGDDVFITFQTEGAGLSIFNTREMESMAPGSMIRAGYGGVTLEFEVSSVDDEYNRLTSLGVPIVKPPTTQPWGLRSVWFRDLDGNIVNFFAKS